MNKKSIINSDFLNSTFPFFIKIDKNGTIEDAGKSIIRLLPNIIGKPIDQIISVSRPQHLNTTYKDLSNHLQKLIFCELKLNTGECFYKGQIMALEDESLCFLCTLFLNDPHDLSKHKITLNDFSISDSSADLLQVLQVNKMVTDDLEKMNSILTEKEKKYSEIIEHANEIIFTTDSNGNFTYMNEIGINFLEIENDITDLKFTDLIQKDHVQRIINIGRQLLSGKIEVGYVEFQLKNSSKWIGQNINLISKSNHEGFQGIGRDITEKKRYEEIILQESKKANDAAASKSQFLANMSHEIRTPLNGIMGLTGLLAKGKLNLQQKKYLDAIKASSETLMVVINDILDISKIESGKMEIKKKAFNFSLCISQMVELMEAKAAEKNLRLESNLDNNIPEIIIGDEPRLNQLLFNIVGNGIKFTQEGSVKINASLIELKDKNAEIEINITDSGIGIPQNKLNGVFQAFQQVNGGENRTQKGTGLGLTITKKLVELMHGTISVKSTPNVGSCFTLRIPFKTGESIDKNLNEINQQFGSHDLSDLKILLAEDNLINQMVTIDILKVYNIEVDLAENGKEAIDMMNNNKYDIILMDMQMPIIDGYQAMETIRKKYDSNQVRMMALTAHVTEGEIKKCLSFGADSYLSKPYNPEDLYNKIIELSGSTNRIKPKKLKNNSSDSILSLNNLERFTAGVKKLKIATIKALIEELPKELILLRKEVDSENYSRIWSLAHRCKPNFDLILNEELIEPIQQIEKLAKEGAKIRLIDDELMQLEKLLEPIIIALNNELKLIK